MNTPLKLIVGLGNPGREYADTRHNAGAWLVQRLADQFRCPLNSDRKLGAAIGRVQQDGNDLRLAIPESYMNVSGTPVAAICNFFKVEPAELLIVHDEIDLPPGIGRFKTDGGAGGNNGLKNIIQCLGNRRDFHRLRIGVGHPGSADRVSGYVLGKPSAGDRISIDRVIDAALDAMPNAIAGNWPAAMKAMNSFKL